MQTTWKDRIIVLISITVGCFLSFGIIVLALTNEPIIATLVAGIISLALAAVYRRSALWTYRPDTPEEFIEFLETGRISQIQKRGN